MKRKNEFDNLIVSFDKDENEGEDSLLKYIDGEPDPKAEKFEHFVKKPATIGIVLLLLAEFILLVVLVSVAGGEKIVYKGSIGLRQILSTAGIGSVGTYKDIVAENDELSEAEAFLKKYVAEESSVLSMLSPSFVSFVQHDYNVKATNKVLESQVVSGEGDVIINQGSTDAPSGDASISTQKPDGTQPTLAPDEPTALPETSIPDDGVTLDGYKYYQFNLLNNGYSTELLKDGASVSVGIVEDSCSSELVVGPDSSGDLTYGNLLIQNQYKAPGFDLREVLDTPLAIPVNTGSDIPRIMLYYTHTSEAFATTADERDMKLFESLATYDETRNVVSCGNAIAEELSKAGVGYLNRTDKNDESYVDAYTVSNQLLSDVKGVAPTLDLAVDIHANALEYPSGSGKRYGPIVDKDGTSYAKILFVVTVGDSNPNWEENIKLAMLMAEKLQEKVPGISMGISLRKDAKYNSTVTDKGLLVEMGFEGNYVSEARASAKIFGEVLGEIYG